MIYIGQDAEEMFYFVALILISSVNVEGLCCHMGFQAVDPRQA